MARSMLPKMHHSSDRLVDAWPVAGWHPPQHDRWTYKMFKPIGAATIEALVDRLPNEVFKGSDALPN